MRIFAFKHLLKLVFELQYAMITVYSFVFNPFQENTYVLHDESKECIIIDPGCYGSQEETMLEEYIASYELTPVRLINTHCHIDHILGNDFVYRTYGLRPEYHAAEQFVMNNMANVSRMYEISLEPSPDPIRYLEEGELISFGHSELLSILTPGHSPASLSFYSKNDGICIAGDVLFYGSIGRTDLPGGNYDTLIDSIMEKLMVLPDETIVYPGHGDSTTIGYERKTNPFLQ